MEPREDNIPVVQIVQLVEHCAGVTEDNVRIPVQAFLASAKVGPKELRGSYNLFISIHSSDIQNNTQNVFFFICLRRR